jgi:hypothetical protein
LGYILGDFFTDTSGHPGNRMAKDEIARWEGNLWIVQQQGSMLWS